MQYLKNQKNSPIRNHYDYVQLIALENCCDFFISVNLIGNNTVPEINDPRRVFTKYFNCIITLEHIIDYIYYDSVYYKKNSCSFRKFKSNILMQYPLLQKISNYANAYKHCMRNGSPLDIDDKDDVAFNKGLNFNLQIVKDSFEFWSNYINLKQEIKYNK